VDLQCKALVQGTRHEFGRVAPSFCCVCVELL
jgi:hypothetical protein